MATLNFKGKPLVWNHHLSVPYHQLVPRKDKSLTDKVRLDDNLIIHGDNLKALKALLPLYGGKVKCVYIDPPYNTGNEGWVYNDAVNSPMITEWLGITVDREDLTRHDKWLCMMTPRLKIIRELMHSDGVIFISIDDNEVHWLRLLMDEIFGEDKFIAQITVHSNPKGRVLDRNFARTHDYVLVYARENIDIDLTLPKSADQILEEFPEKEGDRRFRALELRNTHREFGKFNRPNLYYPIYIDPKKGSISLDRSKTSVEVYPDWDDGFAGCWTWGKEKAEAEKGGLLGRKVGDRWKVFRKGYSDDESGEPVRKKPKTIWNEADCQTEKGQTLLSRIFPDRVFPSPKPIALVEKVLQIANDENAIVLDCFGGSGTTGHAVLAQNKADSGKRRFILIEFGDYADTVTAERIRRVIRGIPKSDDEALRAGTGGTFSYFDIGDSLAVEDLLAGKKLPTYAEMGRYVYYSATAHEFDGKKISEKEFYVGSDAGRDVFLIYKPDPAYLRSAALTLDIARALKSKPGRRKIVFAPTKYLDQEQLDELGIDFAQLPYDLYKSLR